MVSGTGFVATQILTVYAFPEAVSTLIGLVVAAGLGLLDTGAQHGVIGKAEFEEFCERLKSFGLKPRQLPTFTAVAAGVVGNTKFLQTYPASIPTP